MYPSTLQLRPKYAGLGAIKEVKSKELDYLYKGATEEDEEDENESAAEMAPEEFGKRLREAARSGDVERCRNYIRLNNADVNSRSKKGQTVLMLAAKNGHSDVCRYLTSVPNCFIGAKSSRGNTAADLCTFNNELKRFLTTAIADEEFGKRLREAARSGDV